ncbi:beta-glucosidase [Neorhizobium lilium]|uniref:Beta-glucosidase n=1 Tax=Neorhizobium lilium TaxID=2503024 RepID=A0A3S4UQV8_9HYPH|nr:beta-glucosidase [Neorhizobium lilium]RWX78964.1 beta-glucosidase [Neorhizobium lilium]
MISSDDFGSFFLGGFECSSHKRADGRRLDLLRTTFHDALATQDYQQLRQCGISAARDGFRWHLIESTPGQYDWSSVLPALDAARANGIRVIWDLCHYGYPDHVDIWSQDFIDSFCRFSREAARLVRERTGRSGIYCPINEISYWAWAGGDMAQINPCVTGRGAELKHQLVRAGAASAKAIREVDPGAKFLTAEPVIHVAPGGPEPEAEWAAENYRISQYEAVDFLIGRNEPQLGGHDGCLDIIGLNFYPANQWYLGGSTIPMGHHDYRPLSRMLVETYERYRRPILITETGAEGSAAAPWLHYVCAEVEDALAEGVPVLGICLYPILDYPGWENDRMCEVGLFGAPGPGGVRKVHERLLAEIRRHDHLAPAAQKMVAYA